VDLNIDAAGWVTGIKESNFATPRELGKILAANPQCQECVVKQFFRYAMGRHENAGDRPVLDRIVGEFRKSNFQFRKMISAFVRWTEFSSAAELVARQNTR
jgi:hypothetical protein